MLHYYGLARRYDLFALGSEHFAERDRVLMRTASKLSERETALRRRARMLGNDIRDESNGLARLYFRYETATATLGGWLASWLPWTSAFAARRACAVRLHRVRSLMHRHHRLAAVAQGRYAAECRAGMIRPAGHRAAADTDATDVRPQDRTNPVEQIKTVVREPAPDTHAMLPQPVSVWRRVWH